MPYRVLNLERRLAATGRGDEILAFAPLELRVETDAAPLSGVLTIFRSESPEKVGHLRLQFMVDVESRPDLTPRLRELFRALSRQAVHPLLGQDFEYSVPLKTQAVQDSLWFVQDLHFSFKDQRGRARPFVEEELLPLLAKALPLGCGPLQWWTEDTAQPAGEEKVRIISRSLLPPEA